MKKVYLKPAIEILEEELTQMLCSSTVINPGEPNKPAGARESGWDLWDDEEDNPSGSGSIWDE
jgi:hypothetical protein